MRVKILRSTVAGGQRVEKGQVADLSKRDAELLIGLKKARLVADNEKDDANEKSGGSDNQGSADEKGGKDKK